MAEGNQLIYQVQPDCAGTYKVTVAPDAAGNFDAYVLGPDCAGDACLHSLIPWGSPASADISSSEAPFSWLTVMGITGNPVSDTFSVEVTCTCAE